MQEIIEEDELVVIKLARDMLAANTLLLAKIYNNKLFNRKFMVEII